MSAMTTPLPPFEPDGLTLHHPDVLLSDVEVQRVAKVWNGRYEKYKRMWGNQPSHTGDAAIRMLYQKAATEQTPRRQVIVDIGCGYGRDAIEYARRGFDAVGVDIASTGLELANQDYENEQRNAHFSGSATFIRGTIQSAFANRIGSVDGISTHRTLHLIRAEEVVDFATYASNILRPGGIISVGARSDKAFDPKVMEWLPQEEGTTAQYKKREGHVIHFVSRQLLEDAFKTNGHFENLSFSEGTEQEIRGQKARTNLIYMTAQKKFLKPVPIGK